MNHVQRAVTAVVVLVVAAAGSSVKAQQPAASSHAAVRAAIEAGNKKFADGAAKGDAALIATAYTADAEAYPPKRRRGEGPAGAATALAIGPRLGHRRL